MESLSTQLISLLFALLFAVVLALLALVERVRRDLSSNTSLTQETKAAANGTLRQVLEKLEQEEAQSARLRSLVREQQDKLSFLNAKIPEVHDVLVSYRDHRSRPDDWI